MKHNHKKRVRCHVCLCRQSDNLHPSLPLAFSLIGFCSAMCNVVVHSSTEININQGLILKHVYTFNYALFLD